MDINTRISIEATIVCKIVESTLNQGYSVSVWNGGEEPEIEKSRDLKAILDSTCLCDEEILSFYGNDGMAYGHIRLIYGNDGWDVVADYSDNAHTEQVLAEAQEYAEKMEEKYG